MPLTTTTHLSPVVLRVIGGPHGGHAPLATTTHLSPVVLHVMEVPMEGACHSPHAPRSAVGHMMAIGGSHITSRPPPTMLAHDGCAPFTGTLRLRLAYLCHASSPDVHTRFALAVLARLSGCSRSGSRFSHLSSGDSRFIVCNAQCPFLKDGLKWIS